MQIGRTPRHHLSRWRNELELQFDPSTIATWSLRPACSHADWQTDPTPSNPRPVSSTPDPRLGTTLAPALFTEESVAVNYPSFRHQASLEAARVHVIS